MVTCEECDFRGNCPLGEAGRERTGCWDGFVDYPAPEGSAAVSPEDDDVVQADVVIGTGILA